MAAIEFLDAVGRVSAALLLGAVIGLEREWHRHRAGMRTMILISVGSAGFVILSLEIFAHVPNNTGQAEISRVLQGLIGGIGFIGAGTIIHNGGTVYGLTTAAAVWCVAAVGAACGLGLYMIASVLAGATLFTLVALRAVESRYFPPGTNGVRTHWPASTGGTGDRGDSNH